MEGVGMDVGKARQDDPAEQGVVGLRVNADVDRPRNSGLVGRHPHPE
jgi:hypothetical protein